MWSFNCNVSNKPNNKLLITEIHFISAIVYTYNLMNEYKYLAYLNNILFLKLK